jgi:hypothetical protein
VTFAEHPAPSSTTVVTPTSSRATAHRDRVEIFTPGMVPLPRRGRHAGPCRTPHVE